MYKAHANGAVRVSHNSLSEKASAFVHTHATATNLIGLGGGLFVILCLLALPAAQGWNIRLPLYLVLVVWTILRPRVALYLLPIAVPWGSLDPVGLGSLKVNSADILVVLLVAGWLMSFLLHPNVGASPCVRPLGPTGARTVTPLRTCESASHAGARTVTPLRTCESASHAGARTVTPLRTYESASHAGARTVTPLRTYESARHAGARKVTPLRTYERGPLDRETHHFPRFLIFSMLALLIAMLLSLTAASSLSLSLKEIVKWLEAFAVLLLGSQYIRTRRHVWTLLIILCLAAVSQAFLGYAQYAFNLGPASFIRDTALRVYGTFDQPNPYAGYINMSLTILFALMLFGRGIAVRVLSSLGLIILLGAEMLSQSKGGYLALAIALLFIVITGLSHHRVFITTMIIVTFSLISLYLAGLAPNSIFAPLLQRAGLVNLSFTYPTTTNYANSERLAHWVAGLLMFRDHPLFGVGIGNYASAYARYAQGIFVISLDQAHNYYINIAAEAGILGLLSLLWFLSAVFVTAGRSLHMVRNHYMQMRRQLRQPKLGTSLAEACKKLEYVQKMANDRALMIGLIAALLSVCIHNLVDDLYDHSMTILFALLIVMLVRLAGSISKREEVQA